MSTFNKVIVNDTGVKGEVKPHIFAETYEPAE